MLTGYYLLGLEWLHFIRISLHPGDFFFLGWEGVGVGRGGGGACGWSVVPNLFSFLNFFILNIGIHYIQRTVFI